MPVHQSYPYDSGLFVRRPSMLRVVGEALIAWADSREASRARLAQRRALQQLPHYLRHDLGLSQDLGLPPPDAWSSRWER